jgi:hypothetical protein
MPSFSRLKWYALLGIGTVFTIAGAAMVFTGAQHGWPVFLFFGLGMAVFVSELWPGLLLRRSLPPDVLLQKFPGPVELSVDRRKFLFLMVGVAIFAGVALWAIDSQRPGWFIRIVLWLCVIVCAAAIPLLIVLMFRGSSLRLDGEGLEVRHAFRRRLTRWADTSVFEVSTLSLPHGNLTMVVFDDRNSKGSRLGPINASMTGRSGTLPDSYGMAHEELAWLLNAWRRRALAGWAA